MAEQNGANTCSIITFDASPVHPSYPGKEAGRGYITVYTLEDILPSAKPTAAYTQ